MELKVHRTSEWSGRTATYRDGSWGDLCSRTYWNPRHGPSSFPTCPPHLNDPLDELDLPALATKQKGKPVRKGPGLLCSVPGDAGWWPTHQGGACH